MRSILGLAAAGMLVVASSMPVRGQKDSFDDLARKLTGTWAFNQEMSPDFRTTGRGGPAARLLPAGALFEQQGSAQPTQPRYPQGVRANPTNTEPTDEKFADLTPGERAEMIALRQLGRVEPMLTIEATAAQVTFTDDRGDSDCAIDGKTQKRRMFGAWLDVKCRWEKTGLRQEFTASRSRLIRTWSIDDRQLLAMKVKVEGVNQNTPEASAFFDRVR